MSVMKKQKIFLLSILLPLVVPSLSLAQSVGINTKGAAIDPSAIMEINSDFGSTKKGLLPPRVALKNKLDKTTIPNPKHGLIVYNTATAGDFVKGRVYKDQYYYWEEHTLFGGHWQRMVFTPLVREAVIPRVYYIEDNTEQIIATRELNPVGTSGQSTVTGVDVPVLFNSGPVLERKNILTKQAGNKEFRVNISGMYELSAFVNFNPMADCVRDLTHEGNDNKQGLRAFINLKVQVYREGAWRDVVGARTAWGKTGAAMFKTMTVPPTTVYLEENERIRVVIQSPYVSSLVGGRYKKTYIKTSPTCPIAKGFRATLLDFDL